jgi:protease-4
MKQFLKMVLATLVGVLLAGAVGMFFLFVTIGMIGTALSSTETVKVKSGTVLRILLDKPVTERSRSGINNNVLSLSVESSIGLNDILKTIDHAAEDPNIAFVYMDLSSVQIGIAHVEELRNALATFKQSGKPVIAYGDNYSQAAYYLATVADRVYLNPFGSASLSGMSAEVMFYKGLLDKLQIEMQILRHGKFKSAVEPFMADRMSDENREQYLTFIRSIWGHWLDGICEGRQFERPHLNGLIDRLELESARSALDHGLVDGLLYKDELLHELCTLADVASDADLKIIDVADYALTPFRQGSGRNKIAVVYADGDITMGKGESGVTAWDFANTLRQVRRDEHVKAVVFRINSPGGSAQASEIIARELTLLADTKPVVVSMGNYAASGGYWIAAPADKIIVHPTSLTGSIGVFSVIPNIRKGLNEHLGITVDVAKSNASADYPSVTRPLTAHEREVMQSSVEFIYSQFIDKVADSRNLPVARVDEIGQGRVWSGIDAVRLGLADELGGMAEALAAAAELADLSTYRIVELPEIPNPLEQLLKSLMKGEATVNMPAPAEIHTLEHFYKEVTAPGIYARLPYDVHFR